MRYKVAYVVFEMVLLGVDYSTLSQHND